MTTIPSPRSKRRARIEIIPLIDIIFFLLATFVMVSLSMVKELGPVLTGLMVSGRNAAATALSGQITQLMQALGMAGGRFEVSLTPSETEFGAHGSEEVEFLVSANPGTVGTVSGISTCCTSRALLNSCSRAVWRWWFSTEARKTA